jgi:hypothetical protein
MFMPATAAIRSGSDTSDAPPGCTVNRSRSLCRRGVRVARLAAAATVRRGTGARRIVSRMTSVPRPVPAPSSRTVAASGSAWASTSARGPRSPVHIGSLRRCPRGWSRSLVQVEHRHQPTDYLGRICTTKLCVMFGDRSGERAGSHSTSKCRGCSERKWYRGERITRLLGVAVAQPLTRSRMSLLSWWRWVTNRP